MENMSIIDKLQTFLSILTSNSQTIYAIAIIAIFSIVTYIACTLNHNSFRKIYILVYLMMIAILGYLYSDPLLDLLDYLVENIINSILFPNLAIYIAVIVIINVMVIVTILRKSIKAYIRNINIFGFTIMQVFLFFIVKNIIANKINVYEQLSIYTNNELLVLIELSMIFFTIWIIVLGLIKLVDILSGKMVIAKNVNYVNSLVIEPMDYYKGTQSKVIEYYPIKKKTSN